jgi:hypothetical protein
MSRYVLRNAWGVRECTGLRRRFALFALLITCSGALAQAPSADMANYPDRMVRPIAPSRLVT